MQFTLLPLVIAAAFARPADPATSKPTMATKDDFTKLQTALAVNFITPANIPKLVRMSFHDLLNFDKATGSAGAQGCLFDERVASFAENNGLNATAQELQSFVNKIFPSTNFSSGDIVSLAGKVAVEKAFPCIKVKWSFGRNSCSAKEIEGGPGPAIKTLAEMQPFLTRYGLTATEMAVLNSGAHGVAGSVNTQSESGIFSFAFATVSSGVDFIKKSTNIQYQNFGSWFGDSADPLTGSAIGRFPSDMLFFPSTLKKMTSGQPADNSTEIAAAEKTLLAFNEASFNKAFGEVYAKMLLIGTSAKLTPFSDGAATC